MDLFPSDQLPPDEYFFHYTTRDRAFEHILPSRKLRFSSLGEMRDPLENKPWLFPRRAIPDERARQEDGRIEMTAQFNRLANLIRERARLLAFTVDAEDYPDNAQEFGRGWARARMWEQYAENHFGVSLVFHRQKLTESVARSLRGQELPPPYHKDVRYTETGSPTLALDPELEPGNITPQFVAEYIEDHHVDLFFLKALDWRTEYEYRFVVTTPGGDDEVLVGYGDALEAVIVGERFPSWQRASAVQACREVKATPLILSWFRGRPSPWPLRQLRKVRRTSLPGRRQQ